MSEEIEEEIFIKHENGLEEYDEGTLQEENVEEEKIILIVPTEDNEKVDWSLDATQTLLSNINEKLDLVINGVLKNLRQMWEKVSQELINNNYLYSPEQCDNKWKSLKRGYLLATQKSKWSNRGMKRSRPFDSEIEEIISKRQRLKSYLKQDPENSNHNKNENESAVQNKSNSSQQQLTKSLKKEKEVLNKNLTTFKDEISEFTEKEQILQQKSIDILSKIYTYVDGIQKKVYENDETLKSIHKTLEVQNEICLQLDVVKEKLDKSKTLTQLAVEKDREMLKYIKEQNNILKTHLEKLENKN